MDARSTVRPPRPNVAGGRLDAHAPAYPVARRLETAPNIGPVTALSFVATLDRVERFRGPHPAAAYLGLVPGERSSGEQLRRGPIAKRGHSRTRCLLVEAACGRVRHANPHTADLRVWATRIAARRGRRIAAVALAPAGRHPPCHVARRYRPSAAADDIDDAGDGDDELTHLRLEVSSRTDPSAGGVRVGEREKRVQRPPHEAPGKRTAIWDQVPIHPSPAIKQYLSNGAAERLHLETLPGYALHLNPDEGIGNRLKNAGMKNLCLPSIPALRRALPRAVARMQHKRDALCSFSGLAELSLIGSTC